MCGPESIGCRARRSVDAFPGGVLLPCDDLGMDPVEDAHGVADPFGDLGRGHPGRQPDGRRRGGDRRGACRVRQAYSASVSGGGHGTCQPSPLPRSLS